MRSLMRSRWACVWMLPTMPELIQTGRNIKQAIMKDRCIEHPFEPDLSFLYGTIFTGRAREATHHSRNVCVFADGEVDRSATGSGVSARAALHYAKGELGLNEKITIESIIGSTMTVQALSETTFGRYRGDHSGDQRHGAHHRPQPILVRSRRPAIGGLYTALNHNEAESSNAALRPDGMINNTIGTYRRISKRRLHAKTNT